MSLVQAVIERLRSIPGVRSVQGALELAAALKAQAVATPALFVVPLRDSPRHDEEFTGQVMQQVQTTLGVVLVLDNKRDGTGAAAVGDLEPLRNAVRKKLMGWAPEGAEAPFTAGSGQLIDMDGGRVWWGDDYLIEQYWSSDE